MSAAGSAVVVRGARWLCAMVVLCACSGDEEPSTVDFEQAGTFVPAATPVSIESPGADPEPITGQLWLPESASGAAVSSVPLVTFMPAVLADWDAYQMLLEHTASHGYAVLALSWVDQGRDPQRQAARLLYAVNHVLQEHPDAIDPERIALTGHSHGAKVALLAATVEHPIRSRIRTVIAWDPVDNPVPRELLPVSVAPELMAEVHVPTLFFGTPNSMCVPEGEDHEAFFAAAVSPSLDLFFPTGDHVDWGDDLGEGVPGFFTARSLCNRVGELNGYVVHQVTRRSQVAWLKQHLSGEGDMDRYLTGADAPEIAKGVVVATQK